MAYQKHKTDAELGIKVQEHLKKLGIHTPTTSDLGASADSKIAAISEHMNRVLNILGLDLNDDSLQDTPNRVAKMFVNEIYWGLLPENFPKCTAIENKMKVDQMVCETNVSVMSNCEHHLVTIDGLATVAYIPNEKVLGLSKINRIVEYFSKRPQVQERLTIQIAEAMKLVLETEDVAVYIDARHYCVKSRGVEDSNSSTITTHLGGVFKTDPTVRREFLSYATK